MERLKKTRTLLSICFLGLAITSCLYVVDCTKDINEMKPSGLFQQMVSLLGVTVGLPAVQVNGQLNNPPGVDTWCGKAYRATNASFDPGGWLPSPKKSSRELLNLQVYPRMNIYLEDELSGALIVDAALSYTTGEPYCSPTTDGYIASSDAEFKFTVQRADTGATLLSGVTIAVNSSSNEIPLSFSSLPARFEPYDIVIKTNAPHCGKTFEAKTQLSRLPSRTDGGSVTKLDHLYGGLLVQDPSGAPPAWKPIFPYSFYADWGSYLISVQNLTQFASLGYNIVHPTPGGGDTPFELEQFNNFLDVIDELGLWLMYDMRWTFKNLTSVAEQVNRLKSRKSILLWYTGDEPDGQGDPLNSTVLAYNTIKQLDPYHPTSLVLNCYNFHYSEYTKGADIILTDPYPIATNTSFSTLWSTPCNETYGDCGCDDCMGSFRDVSTRMDVLQQYQSWLAAGPKTFWGVPQAFGGSEYWARPPTAKEEVVMALLFVNHNAKGIVAWNFPTTQELTDVTSKLAKVLSADECTSLLLGTKTQPLSLEGLDEVDVAGWRVDKRILVSVVYMGLSNHTGNISIKLPAEVKSLRQVWSMDGATEWEAKEAIVRKSGILAMEVTLMIAELA